MSEWVLEPMQEVEMENPPNSNPNSIPHHLTKARRGSDGGRAPALDMTLTRATTVPPGDKGGDIVISKAKGLLK